VRQEAATDLCFSNNRIVGEDFEFGCLGHCTDIVHLGRYLVRKVRQIRVGGGRLRSARKGLPGELSEGHGLSGSEEPTKIKGV
jgi:hypothetical protein